MRSVGGPEGKWGLAMSHKTVAFFSVLLFVLAVAFGIFEQIQVFFTSFDIGNPSFVGRSIGTAIAVYVMSGAVPLMLIAVALVVVVVEELEPR
jgi:hypothetical protein